MTTTKKREIDNEADEPIRNRHGSAKLWRHLMGETLCCCLLYRNGQFAATDCRHRSTGYPHLRLATKCSAVLLKGIVTMSRTPYPPKADWEHVRRTLSIFLPSGQITELRAPNTRQGTTSGYYDDPERMTHAAIQLSGRCPGVYFTLNPVNSDLLARATNRVKGYAKATTSDTDIIGRRWLPIDFDPKRPSFLLLSCGDWGCP